MSDGLNQITIPDFDDDDFQSTSIPFGRPTGFSFGAAAGQESPTLTTPLAERERSYFHSRGDSVASEDSSISFQQATGRSSAPYAHSSQSSVATTAGSFTKKSSFASIRNAFKSGKSSDAPPVPLIDRQVYPAALKNPFSRSTSSLAHAPPLSVRRPSVTASPPHPRPPNSIAHINETRHGRGLSSKSKSQSHARPQHSHSGSVFPNADSVSDQPLVFGHPTPRQSTPPPVPRVPNGLTGNPTRNGTPPLLDTEGRVMMDPRTPSDYALHAVFMRFATSAELKIENFLKQGMDHDPPLNDFLGPNVDPKFDDLLHSLGRIAIKHTKPVLDSIMRWRKSQQNEPVSGDIIRSQSSNSYALGRGTRPPEVAVILTDRKSLACIYIMCRALIAVMQSISKDALGEAIGLSLEETTFEQFKRPDLKLLAQSANHRTNAELYANLLGQISNLRFVSVTDRFLAELEPVASGQVPKDLDMKYENLVKGLRHVQIKVWPPESFEEGAEFLELLSKSFDNAHGLRLKTAFAETLVQLLHPIGETAQAEVNHPLWAKAIEIIYPKARDMMNKPRYWHVAYPLVVTSLCVAPHEYFLRHWVSCFESGLPKLREKPYRVPVMNGMMRLIWTYLYRCHEPNSTSTSKLDTLLKHFFPQNRQTINPSDEHLDTFVYIVHFVLSRHFDFGCELALTLMQEQAIRATQPGSITGLLSPERTNIALEAILLSLYLVERDVPAPSWPSNPDFSVVPNKEDYPSSSEFCPPSLMSKPGMQEFFDRCGSTVSAIAIACARSVGRMSVFDDQWALSRLNIAYDETTNYVIRQHPEANVAYPSSCTSQITVLHTCFTSWPRCLHHSLPIDEALDMLIHGIVHVEPAIGEAASSALERFALDGSHVTRILSRFTAFLFSPKHIAGEGSGNRLVVESIRLLNAWLAIVDTWARDIVQNPRDTFEESEAASVISHLHDIETGAVFLLSFTDPSIRSVAVKLIRILEAILRHFHNQPPSPLGLETDQSFHVLDHILGKGVSRSYFDDPEDLLDAGQRVRLNQWRQSAYSDVILRMAESEDERDHGLWRFIFPSFTRTCMDSQSDILASCREAWSAAISRYHPFIVLLSGISNRLPTPQVARAPAVQIRERDRNIADHVSVVAQWHLWVKLVCCTASTGDSRPSTKREHTRAPSDLTTYERERMTTTRGLFRYLTPFLDSDYNTFRDTAVVCISSFPSSGYSQLLEDLSAFAARHFYDDARTKVSSPPSGRRNRRQDRLYLAVAHIYQLTAHFLKDQRGIGRQDSLTNVLKFVRHTQAFLSSHEIRGDWQQQRLRRYFCGIVERLFDGLATLQASDRFIPVNMHLTLFRLCEEWCQCGSQSDVVKQRLVSMQTAATAGFGEPQQKAAAIEQFQTETRLLSHAAVGAMASLCQKAFYPPEMSSGSPADRPTMEFLAPLEVGPTLSRIVSMLANIHESVVDGGRKALRSLVDRKEGSEILIDEVIRRSFVTSKEPKTSNCRFFEVVADVICNAEAHPFTFGQVVCLGLTNLCSPLTDTRRQAFDALDAVHIKFGGIRAMSQFECAVTSSATNVCLDGQRQVSMFLAKQHPQEAVNVLAQCSARMPLAQESLAVYASSRVLQSLVPWMSDINLVTEEKYPFRDGRIVLYHMMALTLRYSGTHPEQIQSLWSELVDRQHALNGPATISFLLEQSSKIGSTAFVNCARQVVACLSRSSVGRRTFEDLCEVIEPDRMLPSIDHKFMFPDTEETDLLSDLDALFAEQPRHTLGAAQFALVFLSDVAPPRAWDYKKQLPTILHAIFIHIDHRNPFIRESARMMFFQTMCSWIPGYDDMPNDSVYRHHSTFKSAMAAMERDSELTFWSDEDPVSQIGPRMKQLCSLVLEWLEPLHPTLANEWGSLALRWGTACSIRSIAFRSLQVFRSLMPSVTQSDLALLLGRLTNTIAGPDANIQSFASEIILTFKSLTKSGNFDPSLLPTMYWCAHACLSSPMEAEFGEIIEFLDCLLDRLDLDDPYTSDILISQKPSQWVERTPGLQPLLLLGLRSIVTYNRTFKVLKRLANIEASALIDPSGNRVRDMYTLCLPWCLRAMEDNSKDESIIEYANNVGRLAEAGGQFSISRIMTSFVKSRFRTKDDFLRQAAAALREHYADDQWTEVMSLLLSLVLNQERWLQVKSLQILKVLFQLRETRHPVDRMGSELLMPLLRLLQTDLASQALEVLEEPMAISGGPTAKHVLRMSMHINAGHGEDEDITDVFGLPEESGWCIARPDRQREICRANVMSVFDTCKMPSRPSRVEFEPEIDHFSDADASDPLEADLGDLVQNLHELSTFFQDDQPKTSLPSLPSQHLEARVAAILAKSTDTVGVDSPQTPWTDVFQVGGEPDFDESDEDSGSDYENDTFAFDSIPTLTSNRRNGFSSSKYH